MTKIECNFSKQKVLLKIHDIVIIYLQINNVMKLTFNNFNQFETEGVKGNLEFKYFLGLLINQTCWSISD